MWISSTKRQGDQGELGMKYDIYRYPREDYTKKATNIIINFIVGVVFLYWIIYGIFGCF